MAAITEPITLEASIQNTDRMKQMENNNYRSQEYEYPNPKFAARRSFCDWRYNYIIIAKKYHCIEASSFFKWLGLWRLMN